METGVAWFYEGWQGSSTRLRDRISALDDAALALRAASEGWPVWAVAAHLASARVYWLCGVLGEPGSRTTPFRDATGEGWEDHLDTPRRADEVAAAIDSSWAIVESCLARWSPAMLGEVFIRQRAARSESHTRASVLARLLAHDAYHSGEISVILGMNGLESLDPWSPRA